MKRQYDANVLKPFARRCHAYGMKRIFTLALAAFLPCFAQASIYLEPYAGYALGSFKQSGTTTAPTAASTSTDGDSSGVAYGGKVGLSFLGLAIGGDYMGGSQTFAGSTSTAENIGAFAQLSLPILLKLSATYFFSAKMTGSASTSKGSGLKVGFGYTALPLVSLNFDYIANNYDQIESSGTTYSSYKASTAQYMVSVSLPLDLL